MSQDFCQSPQRSFSRQKTGNEQCVLERLKSNWFFFYPALALIHCLVFSSRVKRWQHSNHFCGFIPRKKEKKKKTRCVLKLQSCNYLNIHLKCYSRKPSFPLAFHRVNQMSFRSTYFCRGQVMLAHTK